MRVETTRAFGRTRLAILRSMFVFGSDEILIIAFEFFEFAQGSGFG
jgi:hypothetical protein